MAIDHSKYGKISALANREPGLLDGDEAFWIPFEYLFCHTPYTFVRFHFRPTDDPTSEYYFLNLLKRCKTVSPSNYRKNMGWLTIHNSSNHH
jgi:hypothetical protein